MDAYKITIGALLHDTGKLLFRSGDDGRAHPVSGAEFLSKLTDDPEILQCVKFHHKNDIRNTTLPPGSPAYIVYVADNIAAAADRRDSEGAEAAYGFNKEAPLESVFNILNNGTRRQKLPLKPLDNGINFPSENTVSSPSDYRELVLKLKEGLGGITFTADYINSLLELSQGILSFVPSSTDTAQLADISLYDHQKITAAVATCIYAYLKAQGRDDYKKELLEQEALFDRENAFIMFSCDVSGIQKFTYTISSENAAKMLRSRSFYLEILMETFADDILAELGLSRANLIYSSGGHCYMLLPNTAEVNKTLDRAVATLNESLFKSFKTLLYMASGTTECSSADLKGTGSADGSSLSAVFAALSSAISAKKLSRYTAEEIKKLNTPAAELKGRECVSCAAVDAHTDSENRCAICRELIALSGELMSAGTSFALTSKKPEKSDCLTLPCAFGNSRYLSVVGLEEARRLSAEEPSLVRIYGKNELNTGLKYATKLWMGTYAAKAANGKTVKTFEELAKSACGIDRLAVLRADVDNLGAAFVAGFIREGDEPYKYETISRKAALSGQLSLFFKKHLNTLLEGSAEMAYFSLTGKETRKGKNAIIIYSGGDDIFLVGAWNEVIEAAVDLYNAFERFTGGALTFSAGIGVYDSSYPISRMAAETEALQEQAKRIDGDKNAVSLFGMETLGGKTSTNHTYKWDVFIHSVAGEKLRELQTYFAGVSGESRAKGNSFLYKLKDYAAGIGNDKINLARCAYLLGRMAPTVKDSKEALVAYDRFSKKVMEWIVNPDERRAFLTALMLYVYLNRESDKEE